LKVFVLLSRFSFPLEKGDKLRAYHQIRTLSKEHKIFLCCLTDKEIKPEYIQELEPFCERIELIKLSRIKIFFKLCFGIFSARPFQYHYFFDRAAQKKIHAYIESYLPKHIYCQLIRTASYVKAYSVIPKTLDYMDALSAGMRRRAGVSGFPLNLLFHIEAKRLSRFEAEIFQYFNHHTIISEQDRNEIAHPKGKSINIVPNGIDESFFQSIVNKKVCDILFAGNMNYSPNVRAAKFIAEEVMPELSKQGDFKFLIAGANPNTKVKALKSSSVEVSGWIDDIRTAYGSAKIFVAPMFIGSGLQNKLLEAMAQGIPCITTSLANNALGAKDNEEILIAETKQEFISHILRLSSNHDEANRIGACGQKFVRKNYSWESESRILTELFETQTQY